MKKKYLALGLVLTYVCMAVACSGNNDKNGNNSGSMAGTETQTESQTETATRETLDSTNSVEQPGDNTMNNNQNTMGADGVSGNDSLLEDAGDAATDVIDGVTNGVNDVIDGVTGSDNTNNANNGATDNATGKNNTNGATVTQ